MPKTFENKQKKPNFNDSKSIKIKDKKSSIVSWSVFVFTLSIVLITLTSVVFPALIASNNSTFNELQDLGIMQGIIQPFILGVWAVPLIVTNFLIFVIAFLYYKRKLPSFVTRSINFVFSFEVSKKVAIITITILLTIYIGISFGDLSTVEDWEDYPGVKKRIDNWSPDQISSGFEPHVRYFLIWSSMILFGNLMVIPFIASISLLVLTYLFTVKISQKRFAGIIALIIVLQSNVFLTYDTTVSYTNFWILFYLLSLYTIYIAWPFSPIFYILSMASKAITATFLPMSLFFIYRTGISKDKKIFVGASSFAIILGGIIAASLFGVNLSGGTGQQEEFIADEFWQGFSSFSYQLRFDGLILLFLLPLTLGLFIASRNGFKHADSMLVLIGGILFTAPLLTGFTIITNQPYRFVPLVVFFAISVGILLSKK